MSEVNQTAARICKAALSIKDAELRDFIALTECRQKERMRIYGDTAATRLGAHQLASLKLILFFREELALIHPTAEDIEKGPDEIVAYMLLEVLQPPGAPK